MRTSLIEIAQIESYLNETSSEEEAVLFEAKMILDPKWKEKVLLQKKAQKLIRQYGDKLLKNELEQIHQRLFHLPKHRSFKQRILHFFK